MKKIIVLGCSGSGKSTFAVQLHNITKLPLYHLDNIWWKRDRTHISRDEFDRKLDELIDIIILHSREEANDFINNMIISQ